MKQLSTLELFVLSCFDRGLETPYDLQRRAGLSLGATNPALKRLIKMGMLKRTNSSTSTNRPRHEYSLSAEGRKAAREDWKDYLEGNTVPSDLDSILRIFDMARHYKAGKAKLIAFLNRAVTARNHAANVLAASEFSADGESIKYRSIRMKFESSRLAAESLALGELITRIKTTNRPKLQQGSLLD